ncbi:MAG TPA: DUF4124 domain-containing protein [Gammaproteobacteria bacterium]|nr:DUF4124 domain-containing protein [Gammaproteobacteria bacterium]
MKLKILIATFSLAAGLCAAGLAYADTPIYKWIDEQGRVHYSTEPHGNKSQQLAIQNQGDLSTPPASSAPGASTAAAAQQSKSDAQLVQPTADDSPACKAGRDRLFKYLHADSLYSIDDKGNKVPLSANDMKKALNDARAYVTQACGGGT